MSQVKGTNIEGDVAVGRHVTAGGNATIRGNALVKKSLRVEGWLDAPNIKGRSKGLFASADALRTAYPIGDGPGSWAVVLGENNVGRIYLWNGEDWDDSGVDYEFQISSEIYESQLEELAGRLDDYDSLMESLESPAILLSDIDNLNALNILTNRHSRYRLIKDSSNHCVGVMDVMWNATNDAIIQVALTSWNLDQKPLTGSYVGICYFYRIYPFTVSESGDFHGYELELNESGWTDWKKLEPEVSEELLSSLTPPSVTPDQMNNMGGGLVAKYAGKHSRYRIVRADNGKIIGVLDIMYDATTQAMTQVVMTHYNLEELQGFTGGSPLRIATYYRSRPLSGSTGLEVNESGWTDWKDINGGLRDNIEFLQDRIEAIFGYLGLQFDSKDTPFSSLPATLETINQQIESLQERLDALTGEDEASQG